MLPSEIDALRPDYRALYGQIVRELRRSRFVRTVELGGSLADGVADEWSDLDFVVTATDGFDPAAAVRAATEVVFLRELPFGVVAITPTWLRLDVVVRGTALREPPHREDRRDLVEEFLRVLGLLPVIVGRREWIVGVDGAMLLRTLLVSLLLAEHGETRATGVKRLNDKLAGDQRALVEALPAVRAERDSIVEAHLAVARVFLARARVLVDDWPSEFEGATAAHLRRELGVEL